MTKLKDKAVGKIKQVIAEIIGDDRLREQGQEQEETAKRKPNELGPIENLNKLT